MGNSPKFVDEFIAWSRLAREQFQVLLVAFLFMGAFFTVVHAMHHSVTDAANLAWIREIAGTVGGVLWGLVKGIQIGHTDISHTAHGKLSISQSQEGTGGVGGSKTE